MDITHPGTVTHGKFVPADPVSMAICLSNLEGKPMEAIFRKVFGKRTRKQGNAWHGIVVPIFMICYCTLNHDEAHYTLLREIHYEVVLDKKGREHRRALPTKDLNTAESVVLYKKAQDYLGSEYNVDVPDPDPNWKGFSS